MEYIPKAVQGAQRPGN